MPVKITNHAAGPAESTCDNRAIAAGRIEIALPSGICIRIDGEVSPSALRRLMQRCVVIPVPSGTGCGLLRAGPARSARRMLRPPEER
ncbi:MAG: hypothetical protein JOY71_12910 [Acetobacteraceae bacterium]|nr:hypothetical protein [Acetobacteraceae bacterium]